MAGRWRSCRSSTTTGRRPTYDRWVSPADPPRRAAGSDRFLTTGRRPVVRARPARPRRGLPMPRPRPFVLEAPTVTIGGLDYGNDSAPPMVFLHGLTDLA